MAKLDDKQLFAYKKFCNIFIGIDPDNKKSGVAYLNRENRSLVLYSMDFPSLMNWLRHVKSCHPEDHVMVAIEGGWLNESNWHVKGKILTPAKAAAMGRNVGMNHQTGILIEQMCDSMNIVCEVVKPLAKGWSGTDRKITAEELEYFTGYSRRNNQDERDAALLVWNYAGLPIKCKLINKTDHGKG